jgi:hypothetical protein
MELFETPKHHHETLSRETYIHLFCSNPELKQAYHSDQIAPSPSGEGHSGA